MVWTQTVKEPVEKDGCTSNPPIETLVADIDARGVWHPWVLTLFDIRIVDTDAPSHLVKSPQTILRTAEREKKLKYGQACKDCHSNFTLLYVSVGGLVGLEMNTFLQHLAQRLSINGISITTSCYFGLKPGYFFINMYHQSLYQWSYTTKLRGFGMKDGSGINDTNNLFVHCCCLLCLVLLW